MNFFKKSLAVLSLLFLMTGQANAVGGSGGMQSLEFWKLDGSNNVTLTNTAWGVTLPVGGTSDGDFDLNGNSLLNIGGLSVEDEVFSVFDDGDNTKIFEFEASGITTGNTRTFSVPDADGTLALTSDLPLTTKGDVFTFSTVNARLGVGNDGEVLTADSTTGTGLKWDVVTGGGATVSQVWQFDSATGDADPSAGNYRLNNATQSSATFMYISDEAKSGVDFSIILSKLEENDVIYFQNNEDASEYHLATLTANPTDATSYWKLPIDITESGSDITDGKESGFIMILGGEPSTTSLPVGYYDGLEVDYVSATTVQVTAGSCRSDDNDENIILDSATNAVITASGANGLDTGSEASSTLYYVWAIKNTGTETEATLISLSDSAPTMPSGYDEKCIVGAFRNNASSNVAKFDSTGKGKERWIWYDVPSSEMTMLSAGSATTWTDVDVSAFVPSLSQSIKLRTSFSRGTFGDLDDSAYFRPNGSTVTTPIWRVGGSFDDTDPGQLFRVLIDVVTDSSQIFEYEVDDSNNDLYLYLLGYQYNL